ncbi:MAG: ABC transporter substrate-binding protein [Anaerolineae bacterium]|nr:ABC transporter substrate-binding protein [Anaerolineae bacterium]
MSLIVVVGLLASGCKAAQPQKVYRIGVLVGLEFLFDGTAGFKEGMAELGYVEGQNVIYDVQETGFDMEVYQRILKQFVADKVDVIFVGPTEATLEAQAAVQGTDIPVVFTYVSLEGVDVVDSIRAPGRNTSGVQYPSADVAVKRFEVLLAMAPQARNILVPYIQDYPNVPPQVAAMRQAAAQTAEGITLIDLPVTSPDELAAALDAYVRQDEIGIDAILFISDPLSVTPAFFAIAAEFAYEHNIPIGGAPMAAGGYESMFGVVPTPFESAKLAAPIVDKVLKGTPAGTIPIVSPEYFIQINYKAATSIGLTVPDSLLVQANEIIR